MHAQASNFPPQFQANYKWYPCPQKGNSKWYLLYLHRPSAVLWLWPASLLLLRPPCLLMRSVLLVLLCLSFVFMTSGHAYIRTYSKHTAYAYTSSMGSALSLARSLGRSLSKAGPDSVPQICPYLNLKKGSLTKTLQLPIRMKLEFIALF